jgi:hypothetical protein
VKPCVLLLLGVSSLIESGCTKHFPDKTDASIHDRVHCGLTISHSLPANLANMTLSGEVLPGSRNLDTNGVEFLRCANAAKQALTAHGFREAEPANCVLFLTYGQTGTRKLPGSRQSHLLVSRQIELSIFSAADFGKAFEIYSAKAWMNAFGATPAEAVLYLIKRSLADFPGPSDQVIEWDAKLAEVQAGPSLPH